MVVDCHAEHSEASESNTERLLPLVGPTRDRTSFRVNSTIGMQILTDPLKCK
jgi:hypothetical protein